MNLNTIHFLTAYIYQNTLQQAGNAPNHVKLLQSELYLLAQTSKTCLLIFNFNAHLS